MSLKGLERDRGELARMRAVIDDRDIPVLMLNLNWYSAAAGYPDGANYLGYVAGLTALIDGAGGRILWRLPIAGQVVGQPSPFHETLGIWYPSHETFLGLTSSPAYAANWDLRRLCVERTVIYRCPSAGGLLTGAIADQSSA